MVLGFNVDLPYKGNHLTLLSLQFQLILISKQKVGKENKNT